jgi:hypothetical protein
MAHRLELSLKDVAKQVKTYERVNTLLAGLFYFYHNSALNRALLQKTFEATKTNEEKLLMPTRVRGTQWIGHQLTAILHIVTSYRFIVTRMEQVSIFNLQIYICFAIKVVFVSLTEKIFFVSKPDRI